MKRPFEVNAPQFGIKRRRDFTGSELRAQREEHFERARARRQKQRDALPPPPPPPKFGDVL